jgi:hypothetical protein
MGCDDDGCLSVVDTRRGVFRAWAMDGGSRKSRRDIVNCSYSKRAREGSGKCGNNRIEGRRKGAEQTLGNRMMMVVVVVNKCASGRPMSCWSRFLIECVRACSVILCVCCVMLKVGGLGLGHVDRDDE